jgi:hypothetical protein
MTPFSLSFKNEHVIHEKTVKCTVKNSEFNYSYNPTLLENGSEANLKSFVTGSDFSPFVTTVGLYDNFDNLVAIAKLSQPLPTSSETDLNILIRLDF